MNAHLQLAPSMMCADFLALQQDLDHFAAAEIDWLHMDIMDGHYVPNLTLGIDYCRAVAAGSAIPQDIHLMVEDPDRYLSDFAQLPKPRITFHPETSRHPVATIQKIRDLGASPGIAIDPALPVNAVELLLPLVDQVCVMTVNPGFAGQQLIEFCLDKIRDLRARSVSEGWTFDIEVDGNVSWDHIPRMTSAGANVLVCGTSSLFQKGLPRPEALLNLQKLIGRIG